MEANGLRVSSQIKIYLYKGCLTHIFKYLKNAQAKGGLD